MPDRSLVPNVNAAPDYGIALLRISLGVMWLAHALVKLVVFTVSGAAAFFESVGLPGVLIYPVLFAEVTGGVALILGIYARQVSLALVPILAVAAWVHYPNGWLHTSPNGGWEYPVFLMVVSVALWLLGDGALVVRHSTWLTTSRLKSV